MSVGIISGGSKGGGQEWPRPLSDYWPPVGPPSDNCVIRLASAVKIVELLYVSIGIEFAQALTTVRNWSMVRVE